MRNLQAAELELIVGGGIAADDVGSCNGGNGGNSENGAGGRGGDGGDCNSENGSENGGG